MGHWILTKDRKIKEVDFITWAKWFGSSPDRIICRDVINGILVSTVFLGLDHNCDFNFNRKPILFETMILDQHQLLKNNQFQDYQERYYTLKGAQAGHKRAINFVKMVKSS